MLRKTSPFAVLLLSCFLLQVPSSPGVWQSPRSVSEMQRSHTDALKENMSQVPLPSYVPVPAGFREPWMWKIHRLPKALALQHSQNALHVEGQLGRAPAQRGGWRLLLCVETVRSRVPQSGF